MEGRLCDSGVRAPLEEAGVVLRKENCLPARRPPW